VENPVTYYAFDVLGVEDFDLRTLPLTTRKALLQKMLPGTGIIRYLDHFVADGEVLYQEVQKLGLEGIVGKRGDSPYKAGRSGTWIKVRSRRSDDFVVVGFTAPKGNRSGFGALQLGLYIDGVLTYCGRAGSGFSDSQLAEVRKQLDGASRKEPACVGTLAHEKGNTWVNPTLVCEVEFTEWTDEGLLRQPVFLRFRNDKTPEECVATGRAAQRFSGEEVVQTSADQSTGEERTFAVTNTDKVFWPDEGYTKGDLLEYYRAISPWMLPYLVDRPLVLTRFPDGIAGKSFYQQDAPGFVPQWIRTQRMYSEQAQKEISYFVGEDEAALLYLVNLGTIPIHVWASRTSQIDRPDWCVLDLDPKGAPFSDVVRTAQTAHQLCDDIGLPNYIKTSGSSGLHVLIPLGCQCRHDEARSLGELLARLIVGEIPEITTLARQISRREGKVYVDYLQNGSGRLIVAPFSARPLPGAPVSMPLRWSEVKQGLDIRAFTIRNAPARMRQLKRDPLLQVVSDQPDLAAVLDRLGKR
jgi:bifunctional non-homologous end joining protein LigD